MMPDDVVLLDAAGRPNGRAPRAHVHDHATPLHLAFSCYVFDSQGRVLLTRRSLAKRTWPGVWTNSFCGHPRPGEEPRAAVVRHAASELALVLDDLELVLPRFRYCATDASGVVENEVCPVWFATTRRAPDPDPAEVAELRWVTPQELGRAVDAAPWALSPWMVEQVLQLGDLVEDDTTTSPSDLVGMVG
nr:isopentenyl-diphosphate Delta-isomerase [Cellulomonas sp. HZM]